MSKQVTLYTPSTGFPDLEAKIALGLARVGVEASGSGGVRMEPLRGFYAIKVRDEKGDLEGAFQLLAQRMLSFESVFMQTPGITTRSAKKLSFKGGAKLSLDAYLKTPDPLSANTRSEPICRHRGKELNSVGNVLGLTAATSYHHERDQINTQSDAYGTHRPTNPKNICGTCALLAILGIWFSNFVFSVGDREILVTPIPRQAISGGDLSLIFSLQHRTRRDWIRSDIPQNLIPLVFLSRTPSSADILGGFDLFFAILSRQQGYHVDGLFLIPLRNYLGFVSSSPYNVSSVDVLLRREAFSALSLLNDLIACRQADSLVRFARLYTRETSTDTYINLLYPETSKYLLEEVAMIKQEIIENEAIGSLARTLRYFVRKRKYQYADNLRNARKDSRDFEDTIAMMLREGRLRLEQDKMIHLPTDQEIKEVFKLANSIFDEVKTALTILAFTFPSKKGERGELTEEVLNA